jgi:hypothetical protein
MDDRVSDLARADVPDRDRGVRRNGVSAEIIRLIPCRRRNSNETTDFPTIVFRFPAKPDTHADTVPCEYVAPAEDET